MPPSDATDPQPAAGGGEPIADPAVLLRLVHVRMPYGRYAGRRLIDLPEPYVVWLSRQGYPSGELGRLLALLYEIKSNGLEYLLHPLRHTDPGAGTGRVAGRGSTRGMQRDREEW